MGSCQWELVCYTPNDANKKNVKSSVEEQIVGNSDYIPYNLWLILFLSEHGYGMKDNILYQYNQSTIRMLKNVRNSCMGNSRHIDIIYFFVKDWIRKSKWNIILHPLNLQMSSPSHLDRYFRSLEMYLWV